MDVKRKNHRIQVGVFRGKQKVRTKLVRTLCGKRDLNPYGVNHTPLKRARLPVPPLPHRRTLSCATDIIIHYFPKMSIPF